MRWNACVVAQEAEGAGAHAIAEAIFSTRGVSLQIIISHFVSKQKALFW